MMDPVRRMILQAAVLAISLTVGGEPAGALDRLGVAVGSLSAAESGFLMAKESGLFSQEGLDVEIVPMASGTDAMQAIVSGSLDVALTGGPTFVNAALAGADVVCIAEIYSTPVYTLVVVPEITAPDQLRGRRLAVSRFGSLSDFATRIAMKRLGLTVGKEVTLLQLGDNASRLAALRAGGVDGTLFEPGATLVARKLGLRELVDLTRVGPSFPQDVVVTSRRLIRDRPELLRSFVRGLGRGTHAFKTQPDDGRRVLQKYLRIDDPETLSEIHAAYVRVLPTRSAVTPGGFETILAEIGKSDPRVGRWAPERALDLRFIRELDESGFFDKLGR